MTIETGVPVGVGVGVGVGVVGVDEEPQLNDRLISSANVNEERILTAMTKAGPHALARFTCGLSQRCFPDAARAPQPGAAVRRR